MVLKVVNKFVSSYQIDSIKRPYIIEIAIFYQQRAFTYDGIWQYRPLLILKDMILNIETKFHKVVIKTTGLKRQGTIKNGDLS